MPNWPSKWPLSIVAAIPSAVLLPVGLEPQPSAALFNIAVWALEPQGETHTTETLPIAPTTSLLLSTDVMLGGCFAHLHTQFSL